MQLYEYKYEHVNAWKYFKNIHYMCVYLIYIYIINIHRTHAYIMQTKTFILYVINRD